MGFSRRPAPFARAARRRHYHSVTVIDACRPYHWRGQFPPANAPSAEIARKGHEKFGWVLDGGKPK
jgi:hypothetical protein